MHRFTRELRRFLAACDGTTAIEYGVIATGVAVAIIAVIGTLGSAVSNMWTTVTDAFR